MRRFQGVLTAGVSMAILGLIALSPDLAAARGSGSGNPSGRSSGGGGGRGSGLSSAPSSHSHGGQSSNGRAPSIDIQRNRGPNIHVQGNEGSRIQVQSNRGPSVQVQGNRAPGVHMHSGGNNSGTRIQGTNHAEVHVHEGNHSGVHVHGGNWGGRGWGVRFNLGIGVRPRWIVGYPRTYSWHPRVYGVPNYGGAAVYSSVPAFSSAAVPGTSGPAEGPSPIEEAAGYLHWQTNDATWDMYHNYVNAPGYRSTYREMYKFLQTVKVVSSGISDAERGVAGPDFVAALTRDLLEANGMLQAMQLDVSKWQVPTALPPDGSEISLREKLERIALTLHEIMSFVGLPPTPTNFLPKDATPSPNLPAQPFVEPAQSGLQPGEQFIRQGQPSVTNQPSPQGESNSQQPPVVPPAAGASGPGIEPTPAVPRPPQPRL